VPVAVAEAVVVAEDPIGVLRARTRRRTLILGLAGSVAVAGGMFWAGTTVHGNAGVLPSHVVEPTPTVAISRRVLTDSLELSGTVEAPSGVAVVPLAPMLPAGATALILQLPLGVGSRVAEGSVLANVAATPIFALQGSIPMYRSLSYAESGADVAQFQRALVRLGYAIGAPDGKFGASTAAAAAAMFAARGFAAPTQTTKITLPGKGLHARKKTASLVTAVVPASDVFYLSRLPGYVASVSARVDQELGPTLLTVASGAPVVTVSIDPSQVQTVRDGMHAVVQSAHDIPGVVSSVEATGSQPTVTVSFAAHPKLPTIGSQVAVTVVRATSHHAVWVAPFSAVGTASDGTNYIMVRDKGRTRRVTVSLGMSIGGVVAITPQGGAQLSVGERVIVND